MQVVTIRHLVESLNKMLRVSQNRIAKMIGLSAHTISNNLDNELVDLLGRKTGKRLYCLYLAAEKLTAEAIGVPDKLEILQLPVFEDLYGNLDSVLTAILQEKYSAEMILEICQKALRVYRDRIKMNNSLFVDLSEIAKIA